MKSGSVSRRSGRGVLFGALLAVVLAVGCRPASDVEQARELQQAGQFEASLEPLRHGIEAHPDDAELHYLYGLALVRTGRATQSWWSLREAMEDSEWLEKAGLLLASAGLATQNHELAQEAADRVLEADPDQQTALLLRARARIASRVDYEGALADSERLLELDPGNREAMINRTVSLLGLKRIDEAGTAIDELQQREDEEGSLDPAFSARLCAAHAIFLREKGDAEKAGERFADCLERYPTQPIVVDSSVEFYDETGQLEQSIAALRKAVEEEPLALAYRGALAARLRAAGRNDEAEQELLDATKLEGIVPEGPWVELSHHYLALAQYDRMASALERAVEVAADPPPALEFSLADALILAERYDDALELAGRMSLPAHRSLVEGRVALDQGRPQEALEHLTEGLRLWPDNAAARYYAARAAVQLGDFDRAIEEYRYSIRSDADATDARYQLAMLHEAEGRYQLAIEAARSGPRSGPDLEADLVALKAAARGGLEQPLRRVMAGLPKRPEIGRRAVLAIAAGTRERSGPAAAARYLLNSPGLDLRVPANAEILRSLVLYAGEAGEGDKAAERVEAALAAHPDVADFHAIQGRLLEQRGAPPVEVRAAYARALELDPEQVQALLGLARLEAAASDPQAALAFAGRAVAAAPDDAEPLRARAELLRSLGRADEAAADLDQLLDRHPYDAEAAASLASLRRDAGSVDERTLELERRAERFGGAGAGTIEKASADSPGA